MNLTLVFLLFNLCAGWVSTSTGSRGRGKNYDDDHGKNINPNIKFCGSGTKLHSCAKDNYGDSCIYKSMCREEECGWDGADKAGRNHLTNPSLEDCRAECDKLGEECRFFAYNKGENNWSDTRYCHLFKTCNGGEGSHWKVFKKQCHYHYNDRVREECQHEEDIDDDAYTSMDAWMNGLSAVGSTSNAKSGFNLTSYLIPFALAGIAFTGGYYVAKKAAN